MISQIALNVSLPIKNLGISMMELSGSSTRFCLLRSSSHDDPERRKVLEEKQMKVLNYSTTGTLRANKQKMITHLGWKIIQWAENEEKLSSSFVQRKVKARERKMSENNIKQMNFLCLVLAL